MLNTFIYDSIIILVSFTAIIVLPYLYFYKIAKNKYTHRMIMGRFLPARKESIFYTFISMIILLGIYFIILMLDSNSIFSFKESSNIIIHIITIIGVLILNDTYFYWIHHLLHVYKPLKKFHKIHHDDITPTPLSALSFHPVEALLNFSFYFLVVLIVPMTKFDLYIVYLYMLVNNTLGHMPLEFCPRWFYKYKFSSLFNAATHHIMHHRNGSSNFSLYYLFWDIKRKTMNRKYYDEFNKVQDSIDAKN